MMLWLIPLAGCGLLTDRARDTGPTLADLEPVQIAGEGTPIPRLALDELADVYREVLAHQQDPETVVQIQHRLADIELLSGEAALAEAISSDRLFDPAIAAYEALLREHPDYERRDTLLYQLSKAYDLRGDPEASARILAELRRTSPDSPYAAEADFRLAERHFAEASYSLARDTYRQVLAAGELTPFYTRSLYMLGWSQFKLARYEEAVTAFLASLDKLLPAPGSDAQPSSAQEELIDDALRVIALSFDNLGGVSAIAKTDAGHGERHYQHRLYAALGALYREKERFADSAAVYTRYMERFPRSVHAHRFALLEIEAHEAGQFPDRILTAKRSYAERFRVDGGYWSDSTPPVREQIAVNLQLYLRQLASHFHAQGQDTSEAFDTRDALLTGVRYYQQYLDSFPESPALAEVSFLLAESLYEAGELAQAVKAYDAMAYGYSDAANAADAAYMTVQLQRELEHLHAPAEEGPTAVSASIDAALKFSGHFPEDPRVPPVLGDASTRLLGAGHFDRAVAVANQLLAYETVADQALVLSAYLTLAHSEFALDRFAEAQIAYQDALSRMTARDSRRPEIAERLSASLYRQGETQRERGDQRGAARLFAMAREASPDSDVGITALHDAAIAYREADDLPASVALFEQLRKQYPDHALSEGVASELLRSFEALEQWQAAATELDRLVETDPEPEARRQALQLAAQYYDRAGAIDFALARYRSYAHTWLTPLEPRMEAMHRLSQLYDESGQQRKRVFWLQKIQQAHAGVEDSHTARTDYLAASACDVLAQSQLSRFEGIRLTLPLRQSLAAKRAEMDKALALHQRCGHYGVEFFTTAASYRIGLIYQQFSEALLASERPAGLDSLALEQYTLMLEEQAYPFEDKAIAVHEANVRRCWSEGVYDQWIKASFAALGSLVPARYAKEESTELPFETGDASFLDRISRGRLVSLNKEAITLRGEGNFAGAAQRYEKALALADDDAVTHRNYGILFELYLGQPARALAHYERYAELTAGVDRTVAGWIAQLKRRGLSLAGEL